MQNETAACTNEYVVAQAELHGPQTQASVHTTLPEAVLSEMSYITTKPKTQHHPRKSPLKAMVPSYIPVYTPSNQSVAPGTEHLA